MKESLILVATSRRKLKRGTVYVGRETVLHSNVPVIAAAWLPNIVLISIAGGVMKVRSRAGNADGHSRRWSL